MADKLRQVAQRLKESVQVTQIISNVSKDKIGSVVSKYSPAVKVSEIAEKFKRENLSGKVRELVSKYEKFTGVEEILAIQKSVVAAQDRFMQAQERRRELGREVAELSNRLKEIHAEMQNTMKGDEKYLHLVTEEHKLILHERSLRDKFAEAEREEREQFAAMSSAVKLGHEREKAHAERNKYWYIVASIMARISYDIPCVVCGDFSSGKHYGVMACDGCAGFFKRSVRQRRQYGCAAASQAPHPCPIDRATRNRCRACRYRRCLAAGMNTKSVQHERGPRTPKPSHSPALSEAAARLLLLNIEWTRTIPAFEGLPLDTRLNLIKGSWRQLFVLGAAQWLCWSGDCKELTAAIHGIRNLGVEQHEFEAMRTVALLGGADRDMPDSPITSLLHRAVVLLRSVSGRADKLFEGLKIAGSVSAAAIQGLFAHSAVGNVPLRELIADVYTAKSLSTS